MDDAEPMHLSSGAGTIYRLGRLTLIVKTTGTAYTLCEAIEPAGWSAALHRHATYDETHIICEGRYECQLGEQRLTLRPGDMMFAPAGTPHSIKNVSAGNARGTRKCLTPLPLGLRLKLPTSLSVKRCIRQAPSPCPPALV